jgi:HrpA-like RNA helicase
VLRYDPGSGLDRLETERIPLDSANQRAGRAGRTGPGRALRLWDPRALLRPHREPEIERVDLAGPFLEVLAWGGDPLRFEWFDPPQPDRAGAALELLEALGAVSDGRITPLGRTLRRFPLHPRLARVLVNACRAGGTREAAAVCAVLSESWTPAGPAFVATDSDVILRASAIETAPWSVRNAASELASLASRVLSDETLGGGTAIGSGDNGVTDRNDSRAKGRSCGGVAGTGDATGIDRTPSETPPGPGAERDVRQEKRATAAGRTAFSSHRGASSTDSDPMKPGTRVDRDDARLTDFHSTAARLGPEEKHPDGVEPGDTAASVRGSAGVGSRGDWRGGVVRGTRGGAQAAHRPNDRVSRATDEPLLKALLAGFPDRVAKRREPASPRLLLFNGQGAVLGRESGVQGGDWLLALDVRAPARGQGPDAIVRAASLIERDWLSPTGETVEHALDADSGAVRAIKQLRYGALVLSETFVKPEPGAAARLLAAAIRARGLGERERALFLRIRFAGIVWDENEWIDRACTGRSSLASVDLASAVPAAVMQKLDRLAPETIPVPSGRSARLEYREDGTVAASVKLQELFGLAETPCVGPRREPVTLLLLAPNGRPVQTTRDLRSFWDRVYPEVRKELRGRYPKHPWPEDPWSAPPTHRTKPRKG